VKFGSSFGCPQGDPRSTLDLGGARGAGEGVWRLIIRVPLGPSMHHTGFGGGVGRG